MVLGEALVARDMNPITVRRDAIRCTDLSIAVYHETRIALSESWRAQPVSQADC